MTCITTLRHDILYEDNTKFCILLRQLRSVPILWLLGLQEVLVRVIFERFDGI